MRFVSVYNHYPSAWPTWNRIAPYADPREAGFVCVTGDVNRFGARFRVARAFRRIELEDYTSDTERGYTALCRVLFTWSAFEQFLKLLGKGQADSGPLLDRYNIRAALSRIRGMDRGDSFFKFIHKRVNLRHKQELENYFNDDPCNFTYLASAIRHAFAHGSLTPNAEQVPPETVVEICDYLCTGLVKVMDDEFSRLLEPFA